jgi:hypothetical protein
MHAPMRRARGRARTGRERVPDADVGEQLRLRHRKVGALERRHIHLRHVQQQALQVGRVAAEPVLQALHERARVLRAGTAAWGSARARAPLWARHCMRLSGPAGGPRAA